MKLKLSITLFLALTITSVTAQKIEEAKKLMYYQRYESAKKILQSAIKEGSNNPDTWYWLGEIYLREKKIDSARKILDEGRSYFKLNNLSEKQYPLNEIGWAHMLLDSGAEADAKLQMDDILKLSKYKDADALLAVAKANIASKNGDIAWALTLLEKAEKKDKNNPEIYLAMGDAYRKLINGSKAVVSYDKVLALDPHYAAAYYKKGLIYKSQNNTEIFTDRFTKAVEADSLYAPALYELYYYYFYRDLKKAGHILKQYLQNSDPTVDQLYMQTDYLYVTKKYTAAIDSAQKIIALQKKDVQPRIFKLIAYSQAALGDSLQAEKNMAGYFAAQKPEECIAKDYELMASLTEANYTDKSRSLEWYKKALGLEENQKNRLIYMTSLADIQKQLGNREREAVWRETIYTTKERPSNIDIYNWGIALYMAENYSKSDSVFAIYEQKYPDQIYGYLWRARCNAILDSSMEKGLAVPHYKHLVEAALKDSIKNKATLLRAYGYLGTYEANISKDYTASLMYFNKILEMDPANADAIKYKEILEAWIEREPAINNNKTAN